MDMGLRRPGVEASGRRSARKATWWSHMSTVTAFYFNFYYSDSFSFLRFSFCISSNSQRDSSVYKLVSSNFCISACLSLASLIPLRPFSCVASSSFSPWSLWSYSVSSRFSLSSFSSALPISFDALLLPPLEFVAVMAEFGRNFVDWPTPIAYAYCSRFVIMFCRDSILMSLSSESRWASDKFCSLCRHFSKSSYLSIRISSICFYWLLRSFSRACI